MVDQQDVTVVVVTHNSAPVLEGVLADLPASMEGIESWWAVVVDSGSTDTTLADVARIAPWAEMIDLGANRGYAAAINTGLAAFPPAIAAVILNPDVRLPAGAVARLVRAVQSDSTGIVAPRLRNERGQLAWSLRRRPTLGRLLAEGVLGGERAGRLHPALSHVVRDETAYEKATTADWVSGAALVISRSCLDAVGSWDESFFLYAEDIDYGLRANDAGFAVRLVPDVEAVHLGGEARVSPRLWSIVAVNRVRLFRKHHGRVGGAAAWVVVTIGEALRAAAGRETSRAALRALVSRSHRPVEVR